MDSPCGKVRQPLLAVLLCSVLVRSGVSSLDLELADGPSSLAVLVLGVRCLVAALNRRTTAASTSWRPAG